MIQLLQKRYINKLKILTLFLIVSFFVPTLRYSIINVKGEDSSEYNVEELDKLILEMIKNQIDKSMERTTNTLEFENDEANCIKTQTNSNPSSYQIQEDAPNLVSPSNGATIDDNTPNLDWEGLGLLHDYNIQVDNNADFSSPEINHQQTVTLYTIPDGSALYDGLHYWRVRGKSSLVTEWGPWSSVWHFTVDTSPDLVSPTGIS